MKNLTLKYWNKKTLFTLSNEGEKKVIFIKNGNQKYYKEFFSQSFIDLKLLVSQALHESKFLSDEEIFSIKRNLQSKYDILKQLELF